VINQTDPGYSIPLVEQIGVVDEPLVFPRVPDAPGSIGSQLVGMTLVRWGPCRGQNQLSDLAVH
jgi:hypothetical protein